MHRFQKLMKTLDSTLIVPGATTAERLMGYGAGVLGALFAGTIGSLNGISDLPLLLLIAGGFDLFGGSVVNATPSGSRRFHESGRSPWAAVGFVAEHILSTHWCWRLCCPP